MPKHVYNANIILIIYYTSFVRRALFNLESNVRLSLRRRLRPRLTCETIQNDNKLFSLLHAAYCENVSLANLGGCYISLTEIIERISLLGFPDLMLFATLFTVTIHLRQIETKCVLFPYWEELC